MASKTVMRPILENIDMYLAVADPGEGPQGPKKKFFETGFPPPAYLRVWMTAPSGLSEGILNTLGT